MPRFYPRNLAVRADQFTGDTVIQNVHFRKAETIDAQRTRGITYDRPARWVFNSEYGPLDLAMGDWIVTYPSGAQVRYSDTLFRQLFEKPTRKSFFKRR